MFPDSMIVLANLLAEGVHIRQEVSGGRMDAPAYLLGRIERASFRHRRHGGGRYTGRGELGVAHAPVSAKQLWLTGSRWQAREPAPLPVGLVLLAGGAAIRQPIALRQRAWRLGGACALFGSGCGSVDHECCPAPGAVSCHPVPGLGVESGHAKPGVPRLPGSVSHARPPRSSD